MTRNKFVTLMAGCPKCGASPGKHCTSIQPARHSAELSRSHTERAQLHGYNPFSKTTWIQDTFTTS